MDRLRGHKAHIYYSKSITLWIPTKRFLQLVQLATYEELKYDVSIAQSCLSASSEHISTVCTGRIRPRSQWLPKTSFRLLLQGLRFSTTCPLCIWHQVCPRATSSTCWQQKPAQTSPMPSHTYSISTRNSCKPEIVPDWENKEIPLEGIYLKLPSLTGM